MNTKPKPTGEYAVGTKTFTVYNTRKEALDPKGLAMRHVPARIYYPIDKSSVAGLTRAHSISRSEALGIRKAFKIPLNYDKIEAKGENAAECYVDAPFIEGKKFPLIVFNHGLFSYIEGNSFLLIELASHGYVVLSVGHPREGAATDFDDGTYELADTSITFKMYKPYIPAVIALMKLMKLKGSFEEQADAFYKCQDKYCEFHVKRVAEWITDTGIALDHARKEFAPILDLTVGIGAAGHSLGGAVAYALCQTDSEYICGLNLDGGLFGRYEGMVMDKPFMQLSCEDNENVVTRAYIRHSAPAYKVLFRDMKHVSFSDMKYAIKSAAMAGKLDSALAHEYTCRCNLEFFDAYLKRIKAKPELKSDNVITVSEFAPDIVPSES